MISKLKQYFDIVDQHNYLRPRTYRNCYRSYFEKYADLFYVPNQAEQLFNFKPHKRSWILQSIKRLGDYYFKKNNNRDVSNLIGPIIERYEVFPLPVVKNLLLQVLFFLWSLIINLILFGSPNISITSFGIYAWQSLYS